MEGLVGSAPEEGVDTIAGEFSGEVGIGAAHGGRGGVAVFGKDDDLDACGGFFADGGVEFLDGSSARLSLK